jgi:glycosyltransferase involved in cell wall biosynthesis
MKEGRSIIFFSQLYYPDITTTAMIMRDLTEDLALYGLNIKVICAQPTYLNKKKCSKKEVHRQVSIRRVWTLLCNKDNILGRILNGMSCFFSMLIKVFLTKKNDLLVFNTNPALLPLLGTIGTKLRSQRYVILIHDLWPELPAHIGMIRKGGLLFKIIDFINKLSITNASGIIVLSNKMRELILNKVPKKEEEIHVIHNWANANRIFPIHRDNNNLIDKFGLRNKRVVMYSGNLGRYQPLEVMIAAANELKHRKDINFVFAGNGGKKERIQMMAASMGLKNVLFIPFQPLDRLAESLSMADVSLIGIYPKNEGVIMPSKLYGLLAVGRPIICVSDPASEVVEILENSGAGLHSAIDAPKELAQKIVKLIDNPKIASKMGLNGRNYFLEHYERKNLTKQWEEVLNKVFYSTVDAQHFSDINNSENISVLRSEKGTEFLYDSSSSSSISG